MTGYHTHSRVEHPSAEVTLQSRIAEFVALYGSLRAVARVLDVSPSYLSRLSNGLQVEPSKELLTKLGLKAITTYKRLK